MGTHKDLEVWKNSIEFVKVIYKLSSSFPKDELHGLTNQIRRSAVSVPANISEGSARIRSGEFLHFLRISLGSLNELETLLIIANNLNYISQDNFEVLHKRLKLITVQLSRLITAISRKADSGNK